MRIHINDLKDSRLVKQKEDRYAEQLLQMSAAQNTRTANLEIKEEPLMYYQTEVLPSEYPQLPQEMQHPPTNQTETATYDQVVIQQSAYGSSS
jgi:hypothetical protein